MSMIVQHNLQAINANRMLGITTNAQSKSAEKLSSGYRINRAADDAAGLSISEKMRKQIRGLTQAASNAQDGISAVQTAEGALNEVQSMLQRMNELAVQAANDSNSETDRQSIQDEIDQLTTEIDRVSETTKFNEMYLLKGDASAEKSKVYSYSTQAQVAATTLYTYDEINKSFTKAVEAGAAITDTSATYYTTYSENSSEKVVGEKIDFNKASGQVVGVKATFANVSTTATVIQGTTDLYQTDGNGNYVLVEKGSKTNANTYYTMDTASDGKIKYVAVSQADVNAYTATGYFANTDIFDKNGNKIANGSYIADTNATYFSSVDKKIEGTAYSTKEVLINEDDIYTKSGDKYILSASGTKIDPDAVYYKLSTTAGGVTYQVAEKDSISTTIADIAATDIYDKDGKLVKAGTKITITDVYYSTTSKAIDTAPTGTEATPSEYLKNSKDFQFTDKDGNEIAANGLYRYFDEDGKYKGGLYTTGQNGLEKAGEDLVNAYVTSDKTGKGALSFSLQVGADATKDNQITVSIDAMDSGTLGIKELSVTGADPENARNAIETIDAALKKVSAQRSSLGAIQNRLEHTIDNLNNVVENTTSAESQIRDVDMAEEMVTYSKNNILAQAGQSMLAQANQATQGVLSILG